MFALFINVTLPFKDKVSPKPVKKKVDEDDFDLMLNISDTENRFTDDDMEEEEEEKEKVQENLNCDMNQNTDSTEDIIPWVYIFNITVFIYLRVQNVLLFFFSLKIRIKQLVKSQETPPGLPPPFVNQLQ